MCSLAFTTGASYLHSIFSPSEGAVAHGMHQSPKRKKKSHPEPGASNVQPGLLNPPCSAWRTIMEHSLARGAAITDKHKSPRVTSGTPGRKNVICSIVLNVHVVFYDLCPYISSYLQQKICSLEQKQYKWNKIYPSRSLVSTGSRNCLRDKD